ncbi:unannotated protein [freshwater metagenome]|uniref:Unannotated protein n=1 Tax=freshwater metagenome TaxID=449393 RepID=A0A6J7E8V4_9ZZZZ
MEGSEAIPEWLPAGRVGRPHGLDGSFYVTRPRSGLLGEGVRLKVGDRETRIVRRAGTDARPILRLEGFDRREVIEGLRGADLLAPRGEAPALGEGEWWAEELEGCRVIDGDVEVGRVRRLLALPSCEVLEVERPDGAELLVPMVRDAIRRVDPQAGIVDVDLVFLGEASG